MRLFSIFSIIAVLCTLIGPGIAQAEIYEEKFDDPFVQWRSNWLKEVSNIENYYGANGGRGNNPTGLWIQDGTGNQALVSITFKGNFGDSINSLDIDAACWSSSRFFVNDKNNKRVFTEVCDTNQNTPVQVYPHHFHVESVNGISSWGFEGSSLLGNTAIDNLILVSNAPVIEHIGDQKVVAGNTLKLTVKARDPEKAPIFYSTSVLPEGATFDAKTHKFSWTPTINQLGTYSLSFNATNPKDFFTKETITITVTGALLKK